MDQSTPFNDRLVLNPTHDHMADKYDDLDTEFEPQLFSSLERHLPRHLLDASRDTKHERMQQILRRYSTKEECHRRQGLEKYRQKIASDYQVKHFEAWARNTDSSILRPNTGNEDGVSLDDIGMKATLNKLMEDYISLISRVLFPDVGGCSLDSRHGYVLQYGKDKAIKEVVSDLHVDDSEVTLHVCLGNQFAGGELVFGGQRCKDHVNGGTHIEKDLLPVGGQAIIHRGCRLYGAKPIKFGHRYNFLMWFKSSVFRELQAHDKGFKDFCDECQSQKSARRNEWVAAKKRELGL
ncbi:2-oxoglutarate and iron-dependent oxygenase domain-containing protein ICU11 isoform X4 [Helianthus annuus]|uniref:2-oxoglutarate and iron-dependent oxygenase domain-containing protein ICU11 isoform X4 n=1 Tax=Helianthus annuus TaxID=4232 RepID=UPI001653183E|nr:2-oxoglutarate and iron-dependent oxygenase domain-containing protein ICU11 isoform X4 [Helianthus annuus]